MGRNTRRVIWTLAAAIAVGVVAPVLFGKQRVEKDITPGDPLRDVIYDFQTLITGVAAVAAAATTIMTMEKTDRASERRHRQLVELQQRPDRRRLDRALHPQIEDLHHLNLQFHDFDNLRSEIERGDGSDWRWATEVARRYLPLLDQVDAVLSRRQFEDGVNLLDGITTRYVEELLIATSRVRSMLRFHLEMEESDMSSSVYFDYDNDFPERFGEMHFMTINAVKLLPRLIASLEFMETKFASEFA